MAAASTEPSQAADGRQLEDEPEPPRGHRAGAEAGLLAVGPDYDAVEVAVLPPFTDLRSVQTLVDGDRLRLAYGAQDVSAHERRRLHRRDLRRDARQARLHLRRGRPFRASRSTTTRPTSWSTRRSQAAIAAGMTPILCVGEGLEVREAAARRCRTRSPSSTAALAESLPSRRARS